MSCMLSAPRPFGPLSDAVAIGAGASGLVCGNPRLCAGGMRRLAPFLVERLVAHRPDAFTGELFEDAGGRE
jgi:hypothetical protein